MAEASDNSDNDEGFITNHLKIDEHSPRPPPRESPALQQFQPRFILGEGILRKEPPEMIEPFRYIKMSPRTYPCQKILPQLSSQLPTAHELFSNQKYYYTAYQRSKEVFGSQQRQTFHNAIPLNSCQPFNPHCYRTLRDWDETSLTDPSINDTCLLFDSHFQGGNLLCAFKSKKQLNTYTLFMQNDTNTYGYNQWFYFSIRNMKPLTKYTFRIANFKKPYSFFSNGLQPLLFSLLKARKQGCGWYRDGMEITYYPSQFSQPGCQKYYTLEFTLFFEHPNDYVTISPYAPYSYSKLMHSLSRLQKVAARNSLSWKLKSIANSIGYNQVPYLILSNKAAKKNKKKVVILARQHSGQTWSSYLVEDLIHHLVEQNMPESKYLLQEYDFHIFPMLNVDGVIYGNFRCDLAGFDLNRTWKSPSPQIHPQIYHIKKEIGKLHDKYGIQMCIDLHTHSKQYGAFAYCCIDSQDCRELPQLISRYSPFFRYKACTFGIDAEKKYTARAAVFGITNNINTLTIQVSAYGFKLRNRKYGFPYTPVNIRNIARAILKGYYSSLKHIQLQPEDQPIQIVQEQGAEVLNTKQLLQNSKQMPEQQQQPIYCSDSEPEADQIEVQVKINTIFPATFVQELEKDKQDIRNSFRKTSKNKKLKKSFRRTIGDHKTPAKKGIDLNSSKEDIKITDSFNKVQSQSLENVSEPVAPIIKIKKPVISMPTSQIKKNTSYNSEKASKAPQKSKPLNLIEFSLKKLPISVPQAVNQAIPSYHIMLDEQAPIYPAQIYQKRDETRFDKTFSTYQAMCRPRVRAQQRKIGVLRQNSRLQQQLPFLCVMSQNKKQIQMQRMRQKQRLEQRQKERSFDRKVEQRQPQIPSHHKNHHNTLSKIKNKQKQLELITKIGLEQFTRYNQSSFNRKQL